MNSINPYDSLTYLVGRTPNDLLDQIKAIKTPIKIVHGPTIQGNRWYVWLTGDIRVERKRPSAQKRVDEFSRTTTEPII